MEHVFLEREDGRCRCGAMCAHCGQGAVMGLCSLQDGSSAAKEWWEPPGQQGLQKASSF